MAGGFENIRFVIVGIIQNAKGEVLIVRRAKEEIGSDGSVLRWVFPGGRLHPPESREQSIQREVLEETGYEVRPIRQLTVRRHPQTKIDVSYFLCRLASEEPAAQPSEPGEIAEIKWVKPAELKKYFTTELAPEVAQELGLA